jgi:type IV fimbrial biogenesis protein FimT
MLCRLRLAHKKVLLMAYSRNTQKEKGFTLIELMITVVVLAVLVAIAGPAFYDTIKRNEVRTQASQIVASLNLARSTAVRRNHPVTMCASSDSTSALVPSCGAGVTWMDGWVVFLDRDEDGTPESGEIVRGFDGLHPGYIIKNALSPISFYPDGTASTATTTNPIYLCPPDKDHMKAWSIELEATGRPQMSGPNSSFAGKCS